MRKLHDLAEVWPLIKENNILKDNYLLWLIRRDNERCLQSNFSNLRDIKQNKTKQTREYYHILMPRQLLSSCTKTQPVITYTDNCYLSHINVQEYNSQFFSTIFHHIYNKLSPFDPCYLRTCDLCSLFIACSIYFPSLNYH